MFQKLINNTAILGHRVNENGDGCGSSGCEEEAEGKQRGKDRYQPVLLVLPDEPVEIVQDFFEIRHTLFLEESI